MREVAAELRSLDQIATLLTHSRVVVLVSATAAPLPSVNGVMSIVHDLRSLLFPGIHSADGVNLMPGVQWRTPATAADSDTTETRNREGAGTFTAGSVTNSQFGIAHITRNFLRFIRSDIARRRIPKSSSGAAADPGQRCRSSIQRRSGGEDSGRNRAVLSRALKRSPSIALRMSC